MKRSSTYKNPELFAGAVASCKVAKLSPTCRIPDCSLLQRKSFEHRCRSKHCCPESLTDLAAKVTAAHVPFELVEERCPRVPEPVLMKLITWSFPRSEADIRRYSAIDCKSNNTSALKPNDYRSVQSGARNEDLLETERASANGDGKNSDRRAETNGHDDTFRQGVAMATAGAVTQSIQIGFHLSGIVTEKFKENSTSSAPFPNSSQYHVTSRSFNVAVTFDRCKVTSSTCNCQNGDGIFFCKHVVAMLLHRMRNPSKVKIRAPISDSLQQLSRDQLQKLTQYLVSRHLHVLPTAQEIADRFCDPDSDINKLHGAPDPTAGASYMDDDRWSLDERHVIRHIRGVLIHSSKPHAIQSIQNVLKKIGEMMKVRDCNGPRLLTITTGELLRCGATLTNCPIKGAYSNLWDEIGSLWVSAVLDPNNNLDRRAILSKLQIWSKDSRCPSDTDDYVSAASLRSNPVSTTRTVLERAIDAGSLDWKDPHLKRILRSGENHDDPSFEWMQEVGDACPSQRARYNNKGQALWDEQTSFACARVKTLRCHGYVVEAVRLAMAICRSVKENRISQLQRMTSSTHRGAYVNGNSLESVLILFDTLAGPHTDDVEQRLHVFDDCTRESLVREAFEVSLLTLGEQRSMPATSRGQEKLLLREKQLIERLKKLCLNDQLLRSLKRICAALVKGGGSSGLGNRIHRNSVPMHSFSLYVFNTLLAYDRELAFKVGTRGMRIPILDSPEDSTPETESADRFYPLPNSSALAEGNLLVGDVDRSERSPSIQYPTIHPPSYPANWSVVDDIEWRQYDLAIALLQAARGEVMLLKSIVESIQHHVRNSSHVFQLSKVVYKTATDQAASVFTPDSTLLHVSMQLVMQVLRMTLHHSCWQRREMVGSLVTCATEIGLCALLTIIKDWPHLFTPVEACTVVAGCVISPNTAMRLNLDPRQRDDVYHTVCKMTVQCAAKDPQSCALYALTLSETSITAFNEVYRIIVEATNKRQMDSSQLYAVARHLDQRGLQSKAFAVAFGATKRLRVAFNHDAHPAASDLLWTTQLAQSLGLRELEDLILVIISKVRSASVLSDVLRTCTSSINGRMPNYISTYPHNRCLRPDRPPLRPLLEASIAAYINTIHSKLSHISPRHYTEFINFLNKARETFLLAPDGHYQFTRLLTNLKTIYKGKKKLLALVTLRFG